ncbi:hypothetical protein AAMO2058_001186000 [Amorphochlora amoebiformis]
MGYKIFYRKTLRNINYFGCDTYSNIQPTMGDKREKVRSFVRDLLPEGPYGEQEYRSKVHAKILLLDNVPKSTSFMKANLQRVIREASQKQLMSNRKGKSRNLYNLPETSKTFTLFKPLNTHWNTYARTLLNDLKLKKAVSIVDLTGCLIQVLRGRCPAYVGVSGIVIKNTKNALTVITDQNTTIMIIKKGTVVGFRMGEHEVFRRL